MADHSSMCLGKKFPRLDRRTIKLARILTPDLPPPPAQIDWTRGFTDWGMLLNDRLGDCTIAAIGHVTQVWRLIAQGLAAVPEVPESLVLDRYEKWDGYDPSDPNTDQGGVEVDVLNDFRRDGFGDVTLDAYADPNLTNLDEVKTGIHLFGGLYIGVALPIAAQSQNVWDVLSDPDDPNGQPNSWGGHAINLVGYDADGLTCITWGQPKRMTWRWLSMYCDEAHALVSKSWLSRSGVTPTGLDYSTLEADLAAVTA